MISLNGLRGDDTFVKIAKSKLKDFLRYIMENYALYAPVKNKVSSFERVEDPSQICLLPNRTEISPKPIFLPPKESLFRWKKVEDGYIIEDCLNGKEKKVIFGARGCDVASLKILDLYMMEVSDPYYASRRKETIIIGITCEYPRESCFCTAFGGMIPDEYDLWLTDIGDYYFVDIGSEKGKELASMELFEKASPEDEERKRKKIERTEQEIRKMAKIELEGYQDMEDKFEDRIWEELGDTCLSCGRCNLICPTCHCFDVRDITNLDGSAGERIRVWDSCHLLDFAKTCAENFRKDRYARVRYRIYDKFVFSVKRYNLYACVGCGRCIDSCHAGIDIRDVLRRLIR